MNMDTLGKLAAPATAKMRLRSKPLPQVPARDYREHNRDSDEQLSESDYDNDMYEDLHRDQEGSYEPPPSHRVFTSTSAVPLQRGDYLDSCRNRPDRPPKTPLRPSKDSKQLPHEPNHVETNEEDYISPDVSNDDDNYVEPTDNPPANFMMHGGNRTKRRHTMLHTALPEHPPNLDVYEVPDKEEKSLTLSAGRLCPTHTTNSNHLPPKPSPRVNIRRSPTTVQEPTNDDEYEVCDHDKKHSGAEHGPPTFPLKPVPRERSPKPPLKPRQDVKPGEFESQTLPVSHTEQKPALKAFSLDLNRPKIPLPQLTSSRQADREVSVENAASDQDKDENIYEKPWFASTCDRKTADEVLLRSHKDGAFMVRKSSGQDTQQPYTLVVFYNGRVYNIPIRFMESTQQYALGREKKGEEYFSSVSHIIENHQRNPLMLIDSQKNSKDAAKLCYPVKP